MPAIQVARTDTFEIQRQKINQISTSLFNITSGGSDLSTGNLRLGDGTIESPSLAFSTDPTVGIYKPNNLTLGFVSDTKSIADFGSTITSYRDIIARKKSINTVGGLNIVNGGENYEEGTYLDILFTGGKGTDATGTFVVDAFTGTITNYGQNYLSGSFTNVSLTGGTGTGSIVSFDVDGISGLLTDSGSGLVPGNYNNVPLTGGSGTGATADISITGNTQYPGTISNAGSGYVEGEYPSVFVYNVPAATYVVTFASNQFAINGTPGAALTLVKGNTYRFDVSDASNSLVSLSFDDNGPLASSEFITIFKGSAGEAGAWIDLIIFPETPNKSIQYLDGGIGSASGGTISITTGTAGQYGYGSLADVTVGPAGTVTAFSIVTGGLRYKSGDQIFSAASSLGGSGSGMRFTLSSPIYDGIVSSITIDSNGQNYQYNDVLSANIASIGNIGSSFTFLVTSDPGEIKNLVFSQKGSGYTAGDVLTAPGPRTGITTVLDTQSNIIIVSNASGIIPGSTVVQTSGTGTLGTGVTVSSVSASTNEVALSASPTANGSATLTFTPPYGDATVDFAYTINKFGVINSVTLVNPGNGYDENDILSVNPIDLTKPVTILVTNKNIQTVTFSGTVAQTAFPVGSTIQLLDGEITSASTTTSSTVPAGANQTFTNVATTTSGSGSGATFDVTRDGSGNVVSSTINSPGSGYAAGDTVTINGNLVGGATPADNITLTVDSATVTTAATVYDRTVVGGNITSLTCDYIGLTTGNNDIVTNSSNAQFTIATGSSIQYAWFFDGDYRPSLTLYVGNSYSFDISDGSNSGHIFSLSEFADGPNSPSNIDQTLVTLDTATKQITVTDTTGILPNMAVTVVGGTGGFTPGTPVYVDTVDNATTLTLTEFPATAGIVDLNFAGYEYTTGVTRGVSTLLIDVSPTTPNLYYYCAYGSGHEDEAGIDGNEALLTVDPNNPKIFGSGAQIRVASVLSENTFSLDIETGTVECLMLDTEDLTTPIGAISALTSTNITTNNLAVTAITNTTGIGMTTPNFTLNGNLSVAGLFNVDSATGDLEVSGNSLFFGDLNINSELFINGNRLTAGNNLDIFIEPDAGRVVKIDSYSALIIPSGDSNQRPQPGVVEDGAIRFNTETDQYEGYNAGTSSWSSLGGVRDLDGNTFILAEETIGANDNTLYFINDNVNTIRITPSFLDFVNVKQMRSLNINAPDYVNWTANTPLNLGDYVRYRNNVYEVTAIGANNLTGTAGSEPIHTSGTATNGGLDLTWFTSAVSTLRFDEISTLEVGPFGNVPLLIGNDLRLTSNTISTDVNDLTLRPNAGKKVIVDAATSFVLPVGQDVDRGNAAAGSVRFNTTSGQFEGYDGANWGSLGGVKDVDQNTKIIPELSPGSNENILYFYNDGDNTLQLTTTALDFFTVDTIRSVTSNELEITAALITLNNGSTSIDNTVVDTTFIHTSKQYLDLGLSAGLTVDPVLRLDNSGDVYFNIGFGTGTPNNVKIFDNELKDFELADLRIQTGKFTLIKGTVDQDNFIVYSGSTDMGAKVIVTAMNPTTGDKEFIELGVVDDGTDVFYTEYGTLRTGANLITATLEFTANSEARINIECGADVTNTEVVNITIISHISKK